MLSKKLIPHFAVFCIMIVISLISPLEFISSQADCSDLLPTRLSVGLYGRVADAPTNLRSGSSTRSSVIEKMPSGTEFEILRGPRCGWYRWWQVQLADGTTGWVAEGEGNRYFIEPLQNAATPVATSVAASLTVSPAEPTTTPDAQVSPERCTVTIPPESTSQLINAINAANVDDSLDTICLEAGIYSLANVDNTNDENGPNGLPIINSPITIVAKEPDATTIERATNAAEFRIFEVAATGHLTLESVRITRGNPGWVYYGGGIYNNGGTLTIRDSQFLGHHAVIGGAILNASGQLDIANSTFIGNSAENFGGAIVNNKDGIAIVNGSRFSDNSVTNISSNRLYVGGAFFNNGTLNIINTILTENRAKDNASSIFNDGILTIIGSCIFNNQVELDDAGEPREITSIFNEADEPINALSNWWGTSDGPSGAGTGSGDAISANISFTPFLDDPECPLD